MGAPFLARNNLLVHCIDLVVLVILPKLHGQTSNCIEVRAAGVMVLCRGFELLSW